MRLVNIILFVLLFPLVVAQSAEPVKEKVFDGRITNPGTIDVEGYPYHISLGSGLDRIVVKPENKSAYVIGNGTFDVRDHVEVFFKDFTIVGHNYTLDSDIFDMGVQVYIYKAYMEVERIFDNTSIIPGQSFDYTVKIRSNGFQPPTSVLYNEFVDNAIFDIESIVGKCVKGINGFMLNVTFGVKEKEECDVRLRAKSNASTTLNANLTFFDGFEHKIVTVNEPITVSKPDIVLSHNVSKALKVGQFGRLNIAVNNTADESISILELSYVYPVMLSLGKRSPVFEQNQDNTILTWKGSVEGKTSRDFFSEFLVSKIRVDPIKVLLRYKVRGITAVIVQEISLDVQKPMLLIGWGNSNYPIHENESYNASLQMFNPANDQMLKNVQVKVTSSLPELNVEKTIGDMVQLQTLDIASLNGPWPYSGEDHFVRLDVSYESAFGEVFSVSERRIFKVLKKEEEIVIEQNVTLEPLPVDESQTVLVQDVKQRSQLLPVIIGTIVVLLVGVKISQKIGPRRFHGKVERLMKEQMQEIKDEKKPGFFSRFRKKKGEVIDAKVSFDDWKSKFYKEHPAFLPTKDQLKVALGGAAQKTLEENKPMSGEAELIVKVIHDLLNQAEEHISRGDHNPALLAYNEARAHFSKHHTSIHPKHKQVIHGRITQVYNKIKNKPKSNNDDLDVPPDIKS